MKTRITIVACLILSLAFTSLTYAQASKEDKPATPATPASGPSEKEMEAWMKYMTPGEMHKLLASQDGSWNEELTMWSAPGAPAMKATATCTNRMILGGRYQESIHNGSIMDMPFEGISVCGYDNAKNVFQCTWIDNMGTGIMYLEGKYDEKTKTLLMNGTMVDPATGKTEKVREKFKFIDENNQHMEMYMTKNGVEFKNMEIKFTRQ